MYGKQITNFVEILEKNSNPFDESFDKDNLYNIATTKAVPENVADFLLNIEENGNKVVELRMQLDLFGPLLGISMTNKVDIEIVLGFSPTPVPTSLCHLDGTSAKQIKHN